MNYQECPKCGCTHFIEKIGGWVCVKCRWFIQV